MLIRLLSDVCVRDENKKVLIYYLLAVSIEVIYISAYMFLDS